MASPVLARRGLPVRKLLYPVVVLIVALLSFTAMSGGATPFALVDASSVYNGFGRSAFGSGPYGGPLAVIPAGPGAAAPAPFGYRLLTSGGSTAGFGGAPAVTTIPGLGAKSAVSMASTPDHDGYWTVSADGAVNVAGTATAHGSMANKALNAPAVDIASTTDGAGYWIVGADGGVFTFGNAQYFGSTGNLTLNQPITAVTATTSGNGYWLTAADGGVFAFGDAQFYGSLGALKLNKPITGIAQTPSGNGYWLSAGDGGVFAFGDAQFYGSAARTKISAPVVDIAPTASGNGYWLLGADGGVFTFGDAPFLGSGTGKLGTIYTRILA